MLQKWARLKAKAFSGKAVAGGALDLVHEALVQAMKDTRHWYPCESTFLKFIGGCMRNISFGWGRGAKDTEPADMLASPVNEEERMLEAAALNGVHNRLRGHAHAVDIFELLRHGYSRRDIKKILGITNREYEAAYKWMCRVWEDMRGAGAVHLLTMDKYNPFWDGDRLDEELDQRRFEELRAVAEAAIAEVEAMS